MSNPSLRNRLRQWIAEETSEAVADCFFPLVENTLRDLGYDLGAPASEEKVRRVKERLRAADAAPARMQRAVREARRAAEKGQSTLEWIQSVQRRAYGKELAEKAFPVGKARLEGELDPDRADLEEPPSPEQVFAFLLTWEELGGTAGVAAIRELLHRGKGNLPTN